jgi:hypothetical protein
LHPSFGDLLKQARAAHERDHCWKRRIETLPPPNALARVYYRREIDDLIDMVEALCS